MPGGDESKIQSQVSGTATMSTFVHTAIQQPAAMMEDGNIAKNWREWKAAFDCYLIASGKDKAPDREKCALFLHVIGKFGREILEELELSESEKKVYDTLVQKFTRHCDPVRNINFERHVFFETYQGDDSFDKFLSSLKMKSKSCEFGSLRNSLILTQLIRGIRDSGMRERLLAKNNLELQDAVSWCRAAETAGQQADVCGRSASGAARGAPAAAGAGQPPLEPAAALEELRGRRRARGRGGRGRLQFGRQQRDLQYNSGSFCGNCGRNHSSGENMCYARNVKCYRCDRVGHFAKMCRAKFVSEAFYENEENPVAEDDCEFLLSNLSVDSVNSCESWYETVNVDNVGIRFKLDSGADVSVLSLETFRAAGFHESSLKKDKVILREISKASLPVVGYFEPELTYKGLNSRQKIYVLDVGCNNLLGLDACKKLKLIARINELSEYNFDESVFEGIGCLPNICKIQVDENVPPVVNVSRKVPIKVRPRLKEELDSMEKMKIIVKEESPTDWVSNIVIVEKQDKKLRLCLDPHHLNKAVRRCHFQLPTLEEITSNISNAKYFSKLDAKKGFWMLRLDEASSKLCTFSTPFGRYRFLRMPFGINCAPEIFHHEMYKIFSMPGVEVYCDDLLVWGSSREEHDRRLEEVMRRAKENGVKFNKAKCMFGLKEIHFLGHVFDCNGIRPDQSRVKAILSVPKPVNRKELERFLGVTNYLSRFIPNYSDISAPLRQLLKKDREFEWCNVHDNAFSKLKELITMAPVLRYYSPREPVTLSVDASATGLGACLMQGGNPVAYAARTLTPTEKRWAQIEKELLAILFGCVRFHQYVYGHNSVLVESDHKPLETIFKKPLNEAPPRLQRMLLRLQAYDLRIVYKPGKMMYIADTLSRAAVESGTDSEISSDVQVHINAMYDNLDASTERLDQIRMETEKDNTLKCVMNYYYNGWPEQKNDVDIEGRQFWTERNELHVINGVLFRNNRIVIPQTLRKEMLARIHEGHLGIEKSKRRARDVMWWPGMSGEIEAAVQRCEPCLRHRAAPPREPLVPHATPALPWEVVGADIFELHRRMYLLVVDYYSKYVEVVSLQNMQSVTVINKMKCIFARFGIPRKLVTDNGTQFTSGEFREFMSKWEIKHVTSSPLYPRSNGLAERNVQTIKKLLTKASEDGTEWQLALLNFRNTPITGESCSPAQLLMGRALNTRLPVSSDILIPKVCEPSQVRINRESRVQGMKEYYDRGTKAMKPLAVGEEVRVKDGKIWLKAVVVGKVPNDDRSYMLKMNNGKVYRRNRSHIMKLHKSFAGFYDDEFFECSEREPACAQSVPGSSRASSLPPPVPTAPVTTQVTDTGKITTRSGRVIRQPDRYGY